MRALKPLLVASAALLVGCGFNDISVSIAPREATVNANAQFQFTAGVGSAGNKTVSWSASDGTVTDKGLFTAPEVGGVCYVTATSSADPSKSAVATVMVVAPVAVTPSQVTIVPGGTQTFTAVITATGDTNVTWSVLDGAAGGTITATGDYTAPAVAGTYRVVATSVADPTVFGIAIVKVDPAI
ncbi:Ig-like domain-containing protein [Geothrix sp.]|uniref:Ig-like domain-containing protein n=1 Tax=Geothrix sp. TaxID=1962974 RepID=UPI0025BBA0D3|nr:Ig-like domain-containing protein [Geothrix sp.]WIL21591.1 MAG: Ig-like domain-containing protein [Geothrix sp.]